MNVFRIDKDQTTLLSILNRSLPQYDYIVKNNKMLERFVASRF